MEKWLALIVAVVSLLSSVRVATKNHKLQAVMNKLSETQYEKQKREEEAQRRLSVDKLVFCLRTIRERTYTFSSAKTKEFREAITSFDYDVPYLEQAVNLAFECIPEDHRRNLVIKVNKVVLNYKKIYEFVKSDEVHPWKEDLRQMTSEIGGCNTYIQDIHNDTNELLNPRIPSSLPNLFEHLNVSD